MDIQLELPDHFDDQESDVDEDYNPFMTQFKSEPFQSFEKLFQNHFDIKENKWVTIPRTQLNLLKAGMKKLKRWLIYLKKEHEMITALLIQNNQMKQKLQENEKLIASLYAAERYRTDLLHQEINRLKLEIKDKTLEFNMEKQDLQEILKDKAKKIAKLERSITIRDEIQTQLENMNKTQKEDLTKLQKELQYINTVKKSQFIDEKQLQGSKISTFELFIGTKIKNIFIPYLDIQSYQQLLRCSRKTYLAISQSNLIIPHAIKTLGVKYKNQVKMLKDVGEEFHSIIREQKEQQIREIMIKQFDLKINFTEFITASLRETQSLIDGDNFLGLRSNNNKDLMESLEGFLQQQQQSYGTSLESLKQEKFPWDEFYPKVLINSQQILAQRKDFPMKSQMLVQQIIQRLYHLGSVCASDSSIFGMFLTQLQRQLASLFVYSQHLVSETNSLQALNYFVMSKFFFILKEKKKAQEQVEDLQTQILLYSEAKKFLNERVKDLEKLLLEKDQKIQDLNRTIHIKETQLNQNNVAVNKNNESIRLYQDKLKILAYEIMDVRRKYKDTCLQYNRVVETFRGLKLHINESF
ncbi:hypothetical protein pb186bvf_008348 [Paramecium bursaria]